MISEKIRPHHLERKAILYVRQSSPHQVLHNRESSALQYAMRDRLIALGWSEIETVDDDLGRSAAGGVVRAGFERMVAEVCLGKVGGNRWTRERVTSLRSNYRIPVYRPTQDGIEPYLNLSKAARLLGITPKTLRIAAESGEIEALHPLPEGPWIFSRSAVTGSEAQKIVMRARTSASYPTGLHPDQQSLFSSITFRQLEKPSPLQRQRCCDHVVMPAR
ncbi:MAG: hypothetical protein WAN75_52180 [Xanthobacteraceae bacterium]|jgi:hypothetical protein